MPRRPRLDYAGARHHVFNRARGPSALFQSDDDCVAFLGRLASLRDHFGVQVLAWSLMPTHYHLLLRSMRGQLSPAIGWLQSEYAHHHNRARGLDGPLFRGRFGNRLVEDEPYWLHLAAYVHLNPVEARLVTHPDLARWTSHGVYTGRDRAPEWMHAGELAESFGTIGGYTAFVEDVMIGREDRPEDLAELLDAPAASTARVEEGGALEELPLLSPEQALRQVASVCDVPVEVIDEVGPGRRNQVRWLAMWWLAEVAGQRNGDLARSFHTVPATISRCQARVVQAGAAEPLGQWRDRLRAARDAAVGSPAAAGGEAKAIKG